jgi:hypothetical protein
VKLVSNEGLSSMADDLTKKRPQDASKVNVHEPWEVEYWTKRLECTPQQLRDAVQKVGPSAEKVRKELGK